MNSYKWFTYFSMILFMDRTVSRRRSSKETVAHIGALRKACQNDWTAIILVRQVVGKGGGNITVGDLHKGFPVLPAQAVDLHGRLAIVGGEHPGAVLVNPSYSSSSIRCVFSIQ